MITPEDMSTPIEPLSASERVRLQLTSDGRAGLFELLDEARGAIIGERFALLDLWAAGRQVFVWRGKDLESGLPVVIKQAAFDFRSPLQYSRKEASRMRQVLRFEHEVQESCKTGHMSEPIALLVSESHIPAARESLVLGEGEVYAVEEWLEAKTLYELALSTKKNKEGCAAVVAASFVSFWEALQQEGWLYVDVNAYNLMLEDKGDKLRVVDAGSVLAASPEINLSSISPAFSTPFLWQSVQDGRPLPGTLALVLPPLAKVLHFLLTGAQPINGQIPLLSELKGCSKECRAAIEAMLRVDANPDAVIEAKSKIEAWRAKK